MPTYAKDTTVPVERSRAEIERILQRYGATGFMYGWETTRAMIGFVIAERRYRTQLPLPDRQAAEFTRTPRAAQSVQPGLRRPPGEQADARTLARPRPVDQGSPRGRRGRHRHS